MNQVIVLTKCDKLHILQVTAGIWIYRIENKVNNRSDGMFFYRNPGDDTIQMLLQKCKTIAVVGLSDKPHRDSYQVAAYLQQNGYRIIPVNPRAKNVLGEIAYESLLSIPEKIDIVNIFRKSEQVPPVVQEALQLKPKAIWLQLGIAHEKAAQLGEAAGITVIMDKCIKIEHHRLLIEKCG